MKSFLLSIMVVLIITGCADDKKKPIPNDEEIESILEEDSVNQVEIDSVTPTEIGPDPTSEKKPFLSNDSLTSNTRATNYTIADGISVTPIEHATMVLRSANNVIYIDPVGGSEAFAGIPSPDFILVTDIHGDHFDVNTINAVIKKNTILIGPEAVKNQLPKELLENFVLVFNGINRGFKTSKMSLDVEGIAMYNLREEALKFHEKGRGNGYVLTINKKRIYISGDTEDIVEMRRLKDIDVAFICMNLPYTMTVESAADAVLDFKPKVVYPYHYRGSDVEKFKQLVNKANKNITVKLLDWYPESL